MMANATVGGLRWLITIIFRCVQIIMPKAIVPICWNRYDVTNFHYDYTNVLLQMEEGKHSG